MGIKLDTIFELLKNYDTYGFDLLYENYFRLMYGVAFSICKDDEMSKDAIQNTMMNLYKLSPQKYPDGNESSWLYKVVKNETLQLLRKSKTKISIDDIDDIPVLDKSIETIVDMDSYSCLIKNLNDCQMRIVTLKIVGGLTHKEIAKMLNIPIGTVTWNYNISIKKIRLALESVAIFIIVLGTAIVNNIISVVPSELNINEKMYITSSSILDSKDVTLASGSKATSLNWQVILYVTTILLIIIFIIIYFKSDKISSRLLLKKTKIKQ